MGQGLRKVLVVGGGTAGWLAANHLAKRLQSRLPQGVRVCLVEAPDIPTIGVGEGTVPAIRNSLAYLGISETELIRQCDATFKQSIQFIDWEQDPARHGSNSYHHLFDYPEILGGDPTPFWLADPQGSYADAVAIQGRLIEAGLGPKLATQAEYQGVCQYAYHLDAAKFGALLARHGTGKLGVEYIRAKVLDIGYHPDGSIRCLHTDSAGALEADLFVDASGFGALLLGQGLKVPLKDQRQFLLCDQALAVQLPYQDPAQPIPCATLATAKEAGWIWDIGLTGRRGLGYVYSSAHSSHEQAEAVLRQYMGPGGDDLVLRRIPMQVGYRERFWEKNCVAIGLSQGFVEPLEATGLLMFDITARMLADQFPASQAQIPAAARRFNQRVGYAWERVIDFVKLHYCLSKRDDSAFWLDNRSAATIPDSLADNLAYWRHQLPSHYDFTDISAVFGLENYLYVLYGMHYPTDLAGRPDLLADPAGARHTQARLSARLQQAGSQLLPHRQLLDRIRQHGLQKI
ncbi:tryptophan 7-halogenase [Gallaecimonas kandeliae]|uniref:tryptophan halogenase family protein n=1 Tax=Gallaecimonas kandeliae TaxID=3029055 RepID=UPI00264A2731|nr:tryptophan halogenase family protein [Gallaecimonas kandeliae]WKE66159.1 tryptophan 7-halogenase [Gallaecimonas kandeliae]